MYVVVICLQAQVVTTQVAAIKDGVTGNVGTDTSRRCVLRLEGALRQARAMCLYIASIFSFCRTSQFTFNVMWKRG